MKITAITLAAAMTVAGVAPAEPIHGEIGECVAKVRKKGLGEDAVSVIYPRSNTLTEFVIPAQASSLRDDPMLIELYLVASINLQTKKNPTHFCMGFLSYN